MRAKLKRKNKDIYPKLMQFIGNSNVVWMFFSENNGFVLYSNDEKYSVGCTNKTSEIEFMEDFNGKIILKN